MTLAERLARSNARIVESTMTPEQVLAMFGERWKLPARRFRVEGSSAGVSRLVSKTTAQSTQKQWSLKAAKMPACIRCGAEAGKGCTKKGVVGSVPPHSVRTQPPSIDGEVLRVVGELAPKAVRFSDVGFAAQGAVSASFGRLRRMGMIKRATVDKVKGWVLA